MVHHKPGCRGTLFRGHVARNKKEQGAKQNGQDSILQKKVLKVLNLPEPVVDHAKQAKAAAKAFEDARWQGAGDAAVSQMFSSE